MTRHFRLQRRDVFVLLLLAVFWFAFYGSLWSGKRYLDWDLDGYHYPLEHLLFYSLKEHRTLPQWDPYIYNGTDFVGNIQAAIFYPPKLLFYLGLMALGVDLTYALFQAFSVAHVLLFSVLVFLVTKRWTGSSPFAAFAALLLPYSGFAQAQLQHFWYFATLCWTPLAVLGLYEGLSRGGKAGRITYVAASVMMLLAGFPHQFLAIQTFLWLAAVACWQWVLPKRIGFASLLTEAAIAFLFIFGIGAIQLLPFLNLIMGSVTLPEGATLPLSSLLTLFTPNHFGHLSGDFSRPWDSTLTYFYSGTFPCLSLVPVLWLFKHPLKPAEKRLLLLLLGLWGVLFLSVFSPVMHRVRDFLPFSVYYRPWSLATLFVMILLTVLLILSFRFQTATPRRRQVSLGIYFISVLSLLVNRPAYYNSAPGSAKQINAQRLTIGNPSIHRQIVKEGLTYAILIDQRVLPYSFLDNWPRIYHVRALSGHDPTVQRSYLEILQRESVINSNRRLELTGRPNVQWLRDNGVKYLVSRKDLLGAGIEDPSFMKEVYSDAEVTVWEFVDARPLFSFDTNCIRHLAYHVGVDRITLQYEATHEGCTVRSTMNMNPFWSPGDSTVFLVPSRTSLGFDICNLKKGNHSIELRYRNGYFFYGSLITLFSMLMLFLYGRERNRGYFSIRRAKDASEEKKISSRERDLEGTGTLISNSCISKHTRGPKGHPTH